MRYLLIVRHCDALPASAGQTDLDRVLSPVGEAQAAGLRTWAHENAEVYGPVTALVSMARRTRQTFFLGFDETGLVTHHEESMLMYNGRRDVSAEDVLIDVAAIDPITTSLMVVGHNPTVHELVVTLLGEDPDELRSGFEPGTVVVLALPDNHQIGLARYDLVEVVRPL
jgi:phosphohistidine phosphatase SixA